MSHNSDKKIHIYISRFYAFTKSFHGKPTIFVSRVKKNKFSVKKDFSRYIFSSFLHRPKKNAGFPWSLACTNRMARCTCQILFGIFQHLKEIPMTEVYALMCQSEFPVIVKQFLFSYFWGCLDIYQPSTTLPVLCFLFYLIAYHNVSHVLVKRRVIVRLGNSIRLVRPYAHIIQTDGLYRDLSTRLYNLTYCSSW